MTPEIHEQYTRLKFLIGAMAPFIEIWEEDRKEFEDKARIYANGTLDAILPHFMSTQDMFTSQRHLNDAIKASKLIGELRSIIVKEAAHAQETA